MMEPDYTDLIERLWANVGPSRRLDADIALIAGGPQTFFGEDFGTAHVDGPDCFGDAMWAGGGQSWVSPHYTQSLDDALEFTMAALPGWGHQVGRPIQKYGETGWYASVFREIRESDKPGFMPGHFAHTGQSLDPPSLDAELRRYAPSPARALLLATFHALVCNASEQSVAKSVASR